MPSTKPSSRGASGRGAADAAPAIVVGPVANRQLVVDLAERLRLPGSNPDAPLIVANQIPQTNSVHLLVIWDKWAGLAIPQRARVIADAYAAAFPHQATVVRLPLGLTPGEAFSQGYLRYQIAPLVRSSDQVTKRQLKDAMSSAGGIVMQVGSDQQLRFATRSQAEEAYRRLLQKINKPIWALSEQVSTSDIGD